MDNTRTVDQLVDASMVGAGLLGGTANIIMQLARPGVGHGVVESTVDSGRLFVHPVKRTRTTFTYLAVAMMGTDEERRQYRRAVDRSHAGVRSTARSPVPYSAFDQDLQLWVAACLYRGFEATQHLFIGPLVPAEADAFYRACARLGTTLQVRDEHWPADRAAFERYWDAALAETHIDGAVRAYLDDVVRLRFLPRPLGVLLGPMHRFVTTGYLPAHFREQLDLGWTPRQQRRFDRLIRATAVLVRILPRPLRQFPFNAVLWDLRRRIRTGRPLV